MANPFAKAKFFHKMGNLMVTPMWKVLPTPAGLALVTTRGRKSGKKRQRVMRAVRDGDRAYAVALLGPRADWLRNAEAAPDVTIKLGGTTHRAKAHRVTTDERARAMDAYRPVAGWYDYYDYLTYVWDIPTKNKLIRQHDWWFDDGTPVVFELSPV
jgi:deazaflavin-dependent oxidoreductase (nitroreductase family)